MWRFWNKLFRWQYAVVNQLNNTFVARVRLRKFDNRMYIEWCSSVYFLSDDGYVRRNEHYSEDWKWEPLTWNHDATNT